jgi:glycosyltransferase involved in cell wall biosynthesis
MPDRTLIQVISTPSGIGGAEVVVIELARGALERGWGSVVLNPFAATEREQLAERLDAGGYEARPTASTSAPTALAANAHWLAGRLATLTPTVTQTSLPHAVAAMAAVPRSRGGLRVLSHQHGMHLHSQRRRTLSALDRLAGRRQDHFVACSQAVADFLVAEYGYPRDSVTTIRNGWSGEPLPRERSEQRPTVICTGRLREQKGHDVLTRAFAQAREEVPNARLVLLGDGPERASIEQLIGDLDLEGSVELAGTQADVWPWLARADVFALASRYEPLGIAVLEAMAAGLPIVATGVDGIREMVEPGVSGELVAAGDVAAMAGRLSALLSDPGRALDYGEAGRRFAETQRMETCVSAYFDLYEELFAQRGQR